MPRITLPDGSEKQFDKPISGQGLAESIGPGLAKAALAIEVDGTAKDLNTLLENDAQVRIYTTKDPEGLEILRHSTAHILAQAIKELYPDAQITIGPVIEHGFYYDIAFEKSISSDDLEKVEERMLEIISRDLPVSRETWQRDDAIKFFESIGEKYKAEIIRDLPENEEISVYRQGEGKTSFVDLCRGPHVPSTGKISKAFKLTSLAGAYWRGDSKNEMLTRIYGTSWATEKELKAHLTMLEEATKRDHRKIGKELEIFSFAPEDIGPGLPLWLPKGTVIRDELEQYAREEEKKAGYHRVVTPVLTKEQLYYKSGHLPYYKEDMYAPIQIDEENYYLRPMNCPHHHHVYLSKPKSYRDLPFRIAEYGNVFRYEAHGALSGLMRTRGFCQNDAHIYCREDQAEEEFLAVMDMHARFYKALGIENFYMRLSKPDLDKLDKYVDHPEQWLKALEIIRSAMKKSGLDYVEADGEAAFYGPKIDFQIKSAIGTEYTISTNQLDFLATNRFSLTYRGSDGNEHPVYVIHRAPLGSHERFVAFLLEHFVGHLPLWLSPIQVIVSGITEKQNDYVEKVATKLQQAGIRVEADYRNEKISYKIREHSHQKIPVILIAGDREADSGAVTVRRLGSQDQHTLLLEDLVKELLLEIETKALPVSTRAQAA